MLAAALAAALAFLQKLPGLDAKQHRELVSREPADREMKPGTADAHGGAGSPR